jgi:inner membrane protein
VWLFAHTGITLGTAVLLNGLIGGRFGDKTTERAYSSAETEAASHSAEAWFVSLGRRIDLRVLLVGSLLPDIIDKPLGLFVFGTFWCRLFCHSLLFLVVITCAGLYLYTSRHRNWLLVLGFGIFMHLVLDEMWLDTHTLLWPLQGFSFPTVYYPNSEQGVTGGLDVAKLLASELVGLVVLGWITWLLVRSGKVYAFIRHGQV